MSWHRHLHVPEREPQFPESVCRLRLLLLVGQRRPLHHVPCCQLIWQMVIEALLPEELLRKLVSDDAALYLAVAIEMALKASCPVR